MLTDELRAAGVSDETRKELIEYYKWIVTLATFVLTVSASLVTLFARGVTHRRLLISGWVLLGMCIVLNWLLVKRLVAIPIVSAVAPQDEGLHHKFFKTTMSNMQVYGLIQNWAFLLGVLLIGLGLVLNLGRP